jgi:uncharacterized protein (TIGR00730 family)
MSTEAGSAASRPHAAGDFVGKNVMKVVSIFGSSLPLPGGAVYEEARQLGRLAAEAGLTVCNGGYRGLMEASARGAREAGGHTVGITCTVWPVPANQWIEEEIRTSSFLERLTTLIERGDAYIVLPGGTGTLAELSLAWEMMNKSALSKTVGGRKPLLVMVPYWQPVIECLNQEVSLGVDARPPSDRRPRAMEIVTLVDSPQQAIRHLRNHF